MRAYIISAGNMKDIAFYKRIQMKEEDLILCADGGYDHAKLMNVVPHAVIGDMDSLKSKIPEHIKVVPYPPEKDKTDTHLCVDYAIEQGADEIILLGALGGRVDHMLANIVLLRYIYEQGAEGMIINHDCRVSVCGGRTEIQRLWGKHISLIPVTDTAEGVTTEGMKYALREATLRQADTIGISNEFTGSTAVVTVRKGLLCVICEN